MPYTRKGMTRPGGPGKSWLRTRHRAALTGVTTDVPPVRGRLARTGRPACGPGGRRSAVRVVCGVEVIADLAGVGGRQQRRCAARAATCWQVEFRPVAAGRDGGRAGAVPPAAGPVPGVRADARGAAGRCCQASARSLQRASRPVLPATPPAPSEILTSLGIDWFGRLNSPGIPWPAPLRRCERKARRRSCPLASAGREGV